MVAHRMLWKLCVVVAFGLSATVTATDVAQEQPKKEELKSGSLRKNGESTTKRQEVPEPTKTDTKEDTDPKGPSKFSVEWYLLPKPINRATLRDILPWNLQNSVPKDCNEPILPVIEKKIRKYFSWVEQKPESRGALLYCTGW
ncbi:SmORF protein [Babesia bovis T2Bo]|uniref:SmORF n=1 Tax=Babesia bovis TaxID=5865 RepID=A7AUL9_BABBO|nr:SmORF protein [Babesia bovis T2Bo]EDO06630.1 SmORF protein [Babesia bovis T2Bo]BAN64853.1 small open reading frame [Babesia bovis]|eukprot:XP_001610198.1 SmORF [Babesia bovis]